MGNKEIILSAEQKIIVELIDGQHLVLAPPGTGKTELLAQRVNIALQRGINSEQIICLTFTNRAAKGMKERIESRHPNNGVFIGNIHHFSSNFLFRNKLISQFTSLLDEEDSDLLLCEAKNQENYSDEVFNPDLLRLNTLIKQNNLNFPKNILLPPEKPIPNIELATKVCKRYESLKEESTLLDFDDLLTLTYHNLTKDNNLNLTKYSWIQVDEVQDLNPIQWEIIKLISANDAHKVFFGDYEQAIFSFMGARLERLHSIEKQCTVHNLQKNFRSPSYLLQIYVDYAKTHLNPNWKKDPIPEKILSPPKDALIITNIDGTNDKEASFIVDNFLSTLSSEEGKQTAVLVRWNNTADLFSSILKSKNIEHFKISGYDLFRRKHIKDIIAFLGCLENKLDRVSWFRIFNIFGKIPTLKDSRHFVNSLFEAGFIPTDFLNEDSGVVNVLEDFLNAYQNERIVVFDTETTGLETESDDIIQIAAIEIIKGQIGKTFEIYLNTEKSLEKTEHIHNISKDFLSIHGENPRDALLKFNDFINGDVLLAHNLNYDWKILSSNYSRNQIEAVNHNHSLKFDSLEITRRLFPKLNSYKLGDLIVSLKFQGSNTHNALDDVKATANLVLFLIPEIQNKLNLQKTFFEQNRTVLDKFNKNLFPFWHKCYENLEMQTSFPELISSYVDYLKEAVNYKFENEDEYHLLKLLRHMEIKCAKKTLSLLLKNHIPEYKLYKEADLIIGDEKIVISTVHKAKGLEFENVIVPECVTDVYPSWASKKEEEINEDARTLYVALSRAMKRLIITTHSISINQDGKSFPRRRTYFLNCIEKYFKRISV